MALNRWSLAQLIRWGGTTVLMVLFAPVAAYLVWHASSSAETALVERARGIARTTAGELVNSLLLNDAVALRETLERAATANDDVAYIVVWSRKGEVAGHTFLTDLPAGLSALAGRNQSGVVRFRTAEGPMVDVAEPIMDGQLGSVHVGLSRKAAAEAVRHLAWPLGLGIACGLGMVLIGAQLIATVVGRPVRRLEAELAGFPKRVPASGSLQNAGGTKEVVALSKSIADMLHRLDDFEHERSVNQDKMVQAERLAALGELAAGLAHEVHNPLDGMLECVRYMEANPADTNRIAKYLPMLREGLDRVAGVMRKMLALARSGLDTDVEAFPVRDVVESLIPVIHRKLEAAGIVLRWTRPGSCACLCNRQSLEQVLLNLMLNAVDAVSAGNSPVVRVAVECDAHWAYVVVEDNGPGVAGQVRDKIFRPFFTTKKVGEGTGLGLSISRQIMRALGGDVELATEPSQLGGAKFVIRMPKAPKEECSGTA